jgi:hypothetical protein
MYESQTRQPGTVGAAAGARAIALCRARTAGVCVARRNTPRDTDLVSLDGEEFVLCSPPSAPKMKALAQDTPVALAIDYEAWPARVLLIRGKARSEEVEGEVPEYPAMTQRYLGKEGSEAWRAQYAALFPRTIRIAIRPEWVGLIDVQTRFPSTIEAAMSA